MIGVIPSASKTYEVFGDFNIDQPIEGKIYYDPKDNRLYYYSLIEKRSNPTTGYFPIWDGTNTYSSPFSNQKFFDKDVKLLSVDAISKTLNDEIAKDIRYRQRRSINDEILKPQIKDADNAFTQSIKGVICALNITIVDLIDMAEPTLNEKAVISYYNALNKITFMRLEKWHVWINIILHLKYELIIYRKNRKILTYKYPEDVYDTGIVKYDNVGNKNDDPFKNTVKKIMVMENISKADLRTDEVDDYTINNMMTTLNGNKPLSSQLFSRFVRMTKIVYRIKLYDKNGKLLFQYKE